MYESNDSEGMILPVELHKRAIEFAREKTGLQRPHRSQTVHIEAFRECFKAMIELGMVTKEFENGPKKDD